MANERVDDGDIQVSESEKRHWGDVEVAVVKPVENTDPETITVDNMFCVATLPADFLFDSSETKPSQIPQLDFYFGDDTLLAGEAESSDGPVKTKFFAMEYFGLKNRLMAWNDEKGIEIFNRITEMIKRSKRVAVIDAHGDTYGDEGDEFWAISGYGDNSYGADRVMRSLLKKDYDLVLLFACNPDDLPLGLESGDERRPAIIRFTLDNNFDIPEEVDQPIKFIESIDNLFKEPERSVITEEMIEQTLISLVPVFLNLRYQLQTNDGALGKLAQVIDSEKDPDEVLASEVFKQYCESLVENKEAEIKKFFFGNEDDYNNMIDALNDPLKLRILLAYYNIDDQTNWRRAGDAICNRQLHKNDGFPLGETVRQVLSLVNSH